MGVVNDLLRQSLVAAGDSLFQNIKTGKLHPGIIFLRKQRGHFVQIPLQRRFLAAHPQIIGGNRSHDNGLYLVVRFSKFLSRLFCSLFQGVQVAAFTEGFFQIPFKVQLLCLCAGGVEGAPYLGAVVVVPAIAVQRQEQHPVEHSIHSLPFPIQINQIGIKLFRRVVAGSVLIMLIVKECQIVNPSRRF